MSDTERTTCGFCSKESDDCRPRGWIDSFSLLMKPIPPIVNVCPRCRKLHMVKVGLILIMFGLFAVTVVVVIAAV